VNWFFSRGFPDGQSFRKHHSEVSKPIAWLIEIIIIKNFIQIDGWSLVFLYRVHDSRFGALWESIRLAHVSHDETVYLSHLLKSYKLYLVFSCRMFFLPQLYGLTWINWRSISKYNVLLLFFWRAIASGYMVKFSMAKFTVYQGQVIRLWQTNHLRWISNSYSWDG